MHGWKGVCLVGALVLAFPGNGPGGRPAAKNHGWIGDYEAARILARKTGKPLMVVFRCEP